MSAQDVGFLVMALLGATVVAAAWGWSPTARWLWAPAAAVLLAAAALVAAVPAEVAVAGRGGATALVVLAGVAAVAGGGPVTARVFDVVGGQPRSGPAGPDTSILTAGTVLRGGTWIGALERAAVFASLASGLVEGVAVVLALKALGRYPELRNQDVAGTAERFIIGTFTSVLWAAACAGVVQLVLR